MGLFAVQGDRVSGIHKHISGSSWDLNPRNKSGVYAFVDVSDFGSSKLLIGQPVMLVPDKDYVLKATLLATNTAKSSVIGVFLGYAEGEEPGVNKAQADAEADGVYAFQLFGEVENARVTEASGFVAGNLLQLLNAGTSFVKSGETNLFDPEVCGIASEDCNAGTSIVLHKVVLSFDNVHEVPAT